MVGVGRGCKPRGIGCKWCVSPAPRGSNNMFTIGRLKSSVRGMANAASGLSIACGIRLHNALSMHMYVHRRPGLSETPAYTGPIVAGQSQKKHALHPGSRLRYDSDSNNPFLGSCHPHHPQQGEGIAWIYDVLLVSGAVRCCPG